MVGPAADKGDFDVFLCIALLLTLRSRGEIKSKCLCRKKEIDIAILSAGIILIFSFIHFSGVLDKVSVFIPCNVCVVLFLVVLSHPSVISVSFCVLD